MKIEQIKALEITRMEGTEGGLEAGIDKASLPFIFDMVTRGFYSNAIGSLIREIASNCFDAHVEAGIDEPVVISKPYDPEEGYSIQFKDIGIGMDAERISNIYMNYFSSTKRDNNTQIGGFGLGSKTPLAYGELFYINTVKDGLKYECVMHKGETKPQLESFYGWDEHEIEVPVQREDGEYELETKIIRFPHGEPTDEHSGTIIRVPIKTDDITRFGEELKFQLAYFDNVWIQGWNISNDYDIYEGDYFKFRSDMEQSDGREYGYDRKQGADIHLVIGNVRYPIDFTKVKVEDKYKKAPIAIKFEIGELQVTPNRENLRYTDEAVKLINERIKLATDELFKIFEEQNPVIDDLADYFKQIQQKPRITFNKEKNHFLDLWKGSKLTKSWKFGPLMHLKIKKMPDNFFSMYRKIGYINSSGRMVKHSSSEYVDQDTILRETFIIHDKDNRQTLYGDLYMSTLFNGEIQVLERMHFGHRDNRFNDLTIQLGIKSSVNRVGNTAYGEKNETGKARIIYEYNKVIDGIVKSKAISYHKPSEEWIKEYKRKQKESTLAFKRKLQNKIFVRPAWSSFKGDDLFEGYFQNRTGILVYGYKEDKEELGAIHNTVVRNYKPFRDKKFSYHHRDPKRDQAFLVLQVSKSNEYSILGSKKTIYWDRFVNTLFFRRMVTAEKVTRMLMTLRSNIAGFTIRKSLIKGFDKEYDKLVAMLDRYVTVDTYSSSSNKTSYWDRSLDQYLEKENFLIPEMVKAFEDFRDNYCYKIPLIKLIDSGILTNNNGDLDSLVDYLKSIRVVVNGESKPIRLNNKCYLKPLVIVNT